MISLLPLRSLQSHAGYLPALPGMLGEMCIRDSSSKAKKVEIKNELGEVVDKMLREVPYSGQSIDGEGFMIEDFPDLNCDVEHCVCLLYTSVPAFLPVSLRFSDVSGHNPVVVLSIVFYLDIPLS